MNKTSLEIIGLPLPEVVESNSRLACAFIRDWTEEPFSEESEDQAHDLVLFIKWQNRYQEFLGYLLAASDAAYEAPLKAAHEQATGLERENLSKRIAGFLCYLSHNPH